MERPKKELLCLPDFVQEQQKEKEIEIEQAKEPELTDEEIDRMIRELERKKKKK